MLARLQRAHSILKCHPAFHCWVAPDSAACNQQPHAFPHGEWLGLRQPPHSLLSLLMLLHGATPTEDCMQGTECLHMCAWTAATILAVPPPQAHKHARTHARTHARHWTPPPRHSLLAPLTTPEMSMWSKAEGVGCSGVPVATKMCSDFISPRPEFEHLHSTK
jgi:hypothetical protein